ncbi:UNVERIFIED_CONTAM: hypothetical protein GTU68_008755 [Idotea baltica]|nr:hypothetical protein [Idotea baltica]
MEKSISSPKNFRGPKAKLNRPIDLRNLSPEELKNLQTKKNMLLNPFENMKIKNGKFLDKIDGRSLCKLCGKSRKYFCYTCYISIPELENDIPRVKLPCLIDIIKHPKETDGKSTAIHASIIAPKEVQIYTYPDIPDYSKEKNVYLMFPTEDAVALEDFLNLPTTNDDDADQTVSHNRLKCSKSISRIIFIDSTWNQTKRLQNDERLKDLPCLRLNTRETLFWRYQKGKPKTYLATIEAIFYFVKDYHLAFLRDYYDGEYDNLLFFFKYMYEKIHSLYDSNELLAYKDI